MKKILIFFLCIYNTSIGNAQEIGLKQVESLSFEELIQSLNSDVSLPQKKYYAQAFLKLAKKKKDTLYIIGGYELLSSFSKDEYTKLKYLDSLIFLSKRKPDDFYPAKAYLDKGVIYYKALKYKKSIDNDLLAFQYSSKYPNIKFQHLSKIGIAAIKNRLGDFESARSIQIKNTDYFEKNINDFNNNEHYLNSLHGLSVSRLYLGEYEMALKDFENGIAFANKYKKPNKADLFRLGSGVSLYFLSEFESSIDSIEKVIPNLIKLHDNQNLIIAYYYLILNFEKRKVDKPSVSHLKKIDSLVEIDNYIDINAQNAFYHLIDFYKKKGDKDRQLKYLKKTITIDSTLDIVRDEIGITINKKFDIPRLLNDKNKLISILDKNRNSYKIYFFVSLLFAFSGILFFYIRQKRYRKKFEALLQKQMIKNTEQIPSPKELTDTNGVPIEIALELISKLSVFEKEDGFLDNNITLSSLAKKMGTNTSYLSKTVNNNKSKGFSTYLNDLRIEYAIHELKNNSSYRKYTISAIATSMGFKSAETFSKFFKAKTGIYPSYYMKQLSKTMS